MSFKFFKMRRVRLKFQNVRGLKLDDEYNSENAQMLSCCYCYMPLFSSFKGLKHIQLFILLTNPFHFFDGCTMSLGKLTLITDLQVTRIDLLISYS